MKTLRTLIPPADGVLLSEADRALEAPQSPCQMVALSAYSV
jgi:hypothetical protein